MTETERRRSPRCAVELPVLVRVGAESGRGLLKSVSRLGVLLESETPYAVGDSLVLVIELPADTFEVRGQVVRAEAAGGVHALGILFSPLALPALAKLESLLATSPGEAAP